MREPQTLVVGDIQGCYGGLMELLDKAQFNEKVDTLCAVGDLVARGDDSLSTLRYLMDLGDNFCSVLGNHDMHLFAVAKGLKKEKKNDRLSALLKHRALPDIIDWLRQFPLARRLTSQHVMVHAGLYPQWSVSKLLSLSDEISDTLKSPSWVEMIRDMYGNGPLSWKDNLHGVQRQRFIINACTRMRFLHEHYELEFATKTKPGNDSPSLKPWYKVPNPSLANNEKVIFGHWAALNGETNDPQFIGLDTGYVWGNSMTALRLETGELIKVTP